MIADLRYLNSLMGYDATRTEKFIQVYKSEIPGQLNALIDQIRAANYEEASALAHGIKSQSSYLMAEEVVTHASYIEDNATSIQDTEELLIRANQLKEAAFKVIGML